MSEALIELYTSALSSGLILLLFVLWLIFRRFLAVRSQSDPALVRLSWELARPVWRQYLKQKLRAMLGTLLVWLGLYALLMAVISPDIGNSFGERMAIFATYALALLAPTAIVIYALSYFIPARYVVSDNGVGIVVWSPFLVRQGVGFLDLGYKPWDRIEQFKFEDDILILKGSRGFLSQGVTELLVPAEQRKAMEELLKERKLARMKGPIIEPPQRRPPRARSRSGQKQPSRPRRKRSSR